jgi:hypothetical protein
MAMVEEADDEEDVGVDELPREEFLFTKVHDELGSMCSACLEAKEMKRVPSPQLFELLLPGCCHSQMPNLAMACVYAAENQQRHMPDAAGLCSGLPISVFLATGWEAACGRQHPRSSR